MMTNLMPSKTLCQVIEIVKYPHENFGFLITGGIDQPPVIQNTKGIFILTIRKNSLAEQSGLKQHDQVLQINGHDLSYSTYKQAMKKITRYEQKNREVAGKENEQVKVTLLVTRPELDQKLSTEGITVPLNDSGEIVNYSSHNGVAFETTGSALDHFKYELCPFFA